MLGVCFLLKLSSQSVTAQHAAIEIRQKKKNVQQLLQYVINFEALDDRPRKAMWGFPVPMYF